MLYNSRIVTTVPVYTVFVLYLVYWWLDLCWQSAATWWAYFFRLCVLGQSTLTGLGRRSSRLKGPRNSRLHNSDLHYKQVGFHCIAFLNLYAFSRCACSFVFTYNYVWLCVYVVCFDVLCSFGILHTHTRLRALFSGTTRVSRYQKGKTNLDFTEARDTE